MTNMETKKSHPSDPRSNVPKLAEYDPNNYLLDDRVPMTVLTDESLTPGRPPCLTQRTVGKFLQPLTRELAMVPASPTINELPEAVKDRMVMQDKAYWVDKPGANAYTLHDAYYSYGMTTEIVKPVPQAVFPRSYQYDLECVSYRRHHGCDGLNPSKDAKKVPLKAYCRDCNNKKGRGLTPFQLAWAQDPGQRRWRYYPDVSATLTVEEIRKSMDESSMVRTYKKVAGSRNYKNYTEDQLEEAIAKITNEELSINAASIEYGIPFGTLYNKYKGLHGRRHGGQPVFLHEEEIAILRAAATCADWGFPLTLLDLRMYAKAFLDKKGRVVERFQNNLPGIEWALSVLKRHKNSFGQRLTTNIKRSRASVGRMTLNQYFDNLEREIENVPPSNIFNYDESNMADDPGKSKCIYRRGVKYPEKVMNFSKSCTTVMICGSADGTLLPPYVIYKSTHLYDTWKERGIVGKPCCAEPCCNLGCRFNRTSSGWIDSPTFRDWFMTSFLPHANRLEGKKVLIGDNLSSHLDTDVLAACASNNISFICLVPNSTHLTQPLDVGFFRPLKLAWRQTLEDWKKKHLKATSVPKETFPHLLKTAIKNMDNKPSRNDASAEVSAIKRNLISSFMATGIYPCNRDVVLRKLPRDTPSPEMEHVVRDSLTDFLREQRYGNATQSEPAKKKKRLNVEPGKSISTTVESPQLGRENIAISDYQEAVNEQHLASSSNVSPTALLSNNEPSTSRQAVFNGTNDATADYEETLQDRPKGPEIGQFILAKFGSKKGKKTYKYVCVIEDICEGNKLVVQGYKSQKKTKTLFREVPNDVSIIEESDIITYLPKPKFLDNMYTFPCDIMIKEL